MKGTILTVGSVTQAVKARRLLARSGIRAKLVKINSKDIGCNYGIEVKGAVLYDVAAVLRGAGIEYFLLGGGI